MLDQLMRDVIATGLAAQHRDVVPTAVPLVEHRLVVGPDPVHGDPMMPGGHLARGIEASTQVVRRDRPEAAIMHIVFACPYDLDGASYLLRQHDRIHDEIEVAIAPPAEAAAHQQIVHIPLFARYVEEVCRPS